MTMFNTNNHADHNRFKLSVCNFNKHSQKPVIHLKCFNSHWSIVQLLATLSIYFTQFRGDFIIKKSQKGEIF